MSQPTATTHPELSPMSPQQRKLAKLLIEHRPAALTSREIQQLTGMKQAGVCQCLEDIAFALIIHNTGWRLVRTRVPNPIDSKRLRRATIYAYTLSVRA